MPQVPENTQKGLLQHKKIFGTLEVLPKDFYFETQNKGERVYIKTRPHPLVNIGWVTNFSFMLIAPLFIYFVIAALPFSIDDFMPGTYTTIIILLIYYSISFTYFLYNFVDWYFDIFLVTNERIVNIEFSPFKQHRVSEARLRNIEDVSESVIGFLPSMFNYGDVKVQTAAQHDYFVFKAVPDPTWFRDVIMDLSKYRRGFR